MELVSVSEEFVVGQERGWKWARQAPRREVSSIATLCGELGDWQGMKFFSSHPHAFGWVAWSACRRQVDVREFWVGVGLGCPPGDDSLLGFLVGVVEVCVTETPRARNRVARTAPRGGRPASWLFRGQ